MIEPLPVMPGTAVIRRMTGLRTRDTIIKPHVQRTDPRRSLGTKWAFPQCTVT